MISTEIGRQDKSIVRKAIHCSSTHTNDVMMPSISNGPPSKRRIKAKSVRLISIAASFLAMAVSIRNYYTAYILTVSPIADRTSARTINKEAAANGTSPLSIDWAFSVDASHLQNMIQEPPTIISESRDSIFSATNKFPIVDIVSIGSITRLDYLTAQIETWASHRSTRHFWGFTEGQDYDLGCAAALPKKKLKQFVTGCETILNTFLISNR